MRKNLFIANWKMHKTVSETAKTVGELLEFFPKGSKSLIAIAPPFTSLQAASGSLKGSCVLLAAQNVHHEEKGAFTGEVSCAMLKELGVRYVIVGHSERRQLFGETDHGVSVKAMKVILHGMTPVVCIGETKSQRDSGKTCDVLKAQLEGSLKGISLSDGSQIVIAYEPVWAIGTGDTATPEIAEQAHRFIRERLSGAYKKSLADNIIILYGGSVKLDNISSLMEMEDIDGALVGGASLEAASFSKIINY